MGRHKKPRMVDNYEDRISSLPKDIMSRILSSLPTRDAVRTSVLSKDWEYKWISIYNIQICYTTANYSLSDKDRNASFISFLYRLFHFTQSSGIKSFCLNTRYEYEARHLNTLISIILRHKIQNLEISAFRCEGIVFPRSFFICNSIRELTIGRVGCTLKIPVNHCFSNLKSLRLGEGVKVSNDDGIPSNDKLRLSFPVMEVLELNCCKWLNVKSVEIDAPLLTRIKDESGYSGGVNSRVITIFGTKVTRFESLGGLVNNYVLNSSSLSYAVLDDDDSNTERNLIGPRAHKILNASSNLKYFKLSNCVLKGITDLSKQLFPLPSFNRLEELVLVRCVGKIKLLLDLLQLTPSLVSLTLTMTRYDHGDWDDYNFEEEILPPCVVHLKKLILSGFIGEIAEINLLKYLMNNANNLEQVLVFVIPQKISKNYETKCLLSTFLKSPNTSLDVEDIIRRA